ncbi:MULTISPECIES: CDP-diacylglycerol--glycerol-3-phosphate 3-phosphatidyltransferase [unclassified Paracoccus (in: a-proteobacteria)]|uniref:CDP-diacylglycerol--glycerol-3-phosphate 3-phosphatidyltransferase n=1 Tax=unclassified Paracoccus (in: a-proteobacteria) TaxID=2688777 RepID=UPI0016035D4D|nr:MULTISPECIES: CDP-diacylglycerol--glycerol-3-phosphate 3-phosphatidyltransferase [unclassified Paracoccus (in: a-proteobacteria)]MBB1490302.1 CDP-diacylglycerol--glycerol-3-phosphate 3-phosphatidyltransferase [Paracoccus sp. MC1854]MBB1498760.1 CDP-diacylglycerol--glycerol-3-phosphate 3-phosphatidyltransferase [Paracoccus sp. MC1862]QQO43921.1 CDP-diacylglycerol--glycerol-3-phosphate 3-phosphatidyltransferase [Paracoccus sp. MC1862]
MRWNLPNLLTLMRLLAAPAVPLMFLFLSRPFADFAALALFVLAALTDWIDGHLARSWQQESRFGAAMDPIADKAMVVIALVVITGYSGMNPWLILPATVILFREVFVAGLREFLGADAGRLKVTPLAKWKTTAQMIAIAVMFLGTGIDYYERGLSPRVGVGRVWRGDWSDLATHLGLVLMWIAAILTAITGWDYFQKARPWLRDVR